MTADRRDPSTLLLGLLGARIDAVERRGFDGETPLRLGVDPLIVRAGALALYLTVDGGRGDLLVFELSAVAAGALRGTQSFALGDHDEDARVVAQLSAPVLGIDQLARAPGGGPAGFYQRCGIRLRLQGGGSLYLGTHLRAIADTDDLCILHPDETRDDLVATPLRRP